jgi:hypothetical protein
MATTNNMENNDSPEFDEPTEADKDLVSFVVGQCDNWRDWRDSNYLELWNEYERIFRGVWASEDKTRDSERSRIISPATQQAVETRHAEIMEAIFGNGDFFDIEDDVTDVNGTELDVNQIKAQLMDDFKKDKIRKAIDQIELMAEIYGTGIGEIIVKTEKEYVPATQPIPGVVGQAAIGVQEKDRTAVKIMPVNPKNFLFDPNGTSVDDCLGVAVEKYVGLHKIVKGIEDGIYRKVNVGPMYDTEDLEVTQEDTQYQTDKVKLLTYYGLVPREYLTDMGDTEELMDLFPEESDADEYTDMVEAIVVIVNDSTLLKAEENPYMMKDRPVVLYQDDTVPNRILGRGTVEKAYNMQKAIDAQMRSHLDSLALTTAPMIGIDATRLPRGAKFEVRPGKAILTNGNPNEILQPFKFGQTDGNNMTTAQAFERMLLQATGTLDSQGMVSQVARDAGGAGMSAAMASIIKKYKRTLTNFQEDFLIPFIKKAAFRYMQFDPERYPSVDMNFMPTATLGIMAREYEQQQFIALLQTLGPQTPVLPVILKGIVQNSSLSNKNEMLAGLDQMSKPNPEQQQMQMQQQMLAMQTAQAQLALLQAQTAERAANAQQTQVETQLMPEEMRVKVVQAASNNLDRGDDFGKRLQLADRVLKEKEINLKAADIQSNERIAALQMMKRASNS